jgi:hypothetical protein
MSFTMPTVTSSADMPLHPSTTGTVKLGGGLAFVTGPLIGSDTNQWYFGTGGASGLIIEDGIDFAGDDNGPVFFGPDDIAGFNLLHAPIIGTPTVTKSGDTFTLTLSLGPLDVSGSAPDKINAFYALDPSTQWYGNLTLDFSGVGSPGGDFHNTSGVTGLLIETASREPPSLVLLAPLITGLVAFTIHRRKAGIRVD